MHCLLCDWEEPTQARQVKSKSRSKSPIGGLPPRQTEVFRTSDGWIRKTVLSDLHVVFTIFQSIHLEARHHEC